MSKSNKSRVVLYICAFIVPALLAFPVYGNQLQTVADWAMFVLVAPMVYAMYRLFYKAISIFE